jgi:hypothetical protein
MVKDVSCSKAYHFISRTSRDNRWRNSLFPNSNSISYKEIESQNRILLFFLPDNFFPGYEPITFIAEKSLTTLGTDLEFFAALRAVRFHIKFVIQGIAVTALAEELDSFRGKFLYHFRTTFTAYSSNHDKLPCN